MSLMKSLTSSALGLFLFTFMATSVLAEGTVDGLSFFKKLKLARAGDQEAQISIAADYENGLNTARKDAVEAARWYREAALAGSVEAQYRLAKLLTVGAAGIAADPAGGLKLLESAAAKGHAPSQNELGLRYQTGNGVKADAKIASDWFRKAADQKLPQAKVNLGLMLVKGEGVPQDRNEAFKQFNDAVQAGDVWAMNNIGSMYEMGWGTTKDVAKAKEFYSQAAAKGNQSAAANLKRLQDKGL
jgi:TPR repeat protein